jgi:ParB family chromosome partitioning protein
MPPINRLEAARSLNLTHVECVVVRWDDRQARMWEIAENLHRADLTELQRKEQIAEWIALKEVDHSAQFAPNVSRREDGRGHRREGGINAAARDLGIDRTEAQRAVKVAGISERAKQAARDARLDNNQSALLKIARAAPEQQEATNRQ